MTPIVFRVFTAAALGSGVLLTISEFQDFIFPKIIAAVAVIGFLGACGWRLYSSSSR